MCGVEGLTTQQNYGKHRDDEFMIYFMKYMTNEEISEHGDYGVLMAKKHHMMHISLGIGGSRNI